MFNESVHCLGMHMCLVPAREIEWYITAMFEKQALGLSNDVKDTNRRFVGCDGVRTVALSQLPWQAVATTIKFVSGIYEARRDLDWVQEEEVVPQPVVRVVLVKRRAMFLSGSSTNTPPP